MEKMDYSDLQGIAEKYKSERDHLIGVVECAARILGDELWLEINNLHANETRAKAAARKNAKKEE